MKLRRFLILAAVVGACLLVIVNLGDTAKFLAALRRLQWYVVPLFIAVQLASYYANAQFYQRFLAISHHRVGLRRLFEASLAVNFANQALPSGGVAGTTYLTQAVKDTVPAGVVTLAQLGRYLFTFATYLVVMLVGLLLLFVGNDLHKVSVRLTLLVMVVILALAVAAIIAFSDRSRLEAIVYPATDALNRLGRRFGRRGMIVAPAARDRFLNELYDGYAQLRRHKRRWPGLLAWSVIYNLTEVLTVYVVFLGLGVWVNFGIVITGYALAILASIAGIVTGGVGVYELGMIGTFAALGVPFATAVSVVLVYRVLSMVLFLPPGLYFYRRHLHQPSEATA